MLAVVALLVAASPASVECLSLLATCKVAFDQMPIQLLCEVVLLERRTIQRYRLLGMTGAFVALRQCKHPMAAPEV